MWMLLFMVLPLVGIAYVCWHVWAVLPLATVWKLLIIILGIGCFLLLFVNFRGVLENQPLALARASYEIGTSTLFILLYLVILFLLLDLGRLVHLVPRSWLFHNGVTALAILGLMVAVFLYGNIHYKNKVRVPLELTTSKPLAKDYTIVMVSDLHIGYHNTRSELARWIDLINAEHPDLVLIAGDIIDMSMRPLIEENMAEEFHRLQAPVYACLGNHEHFGRAPQAKQFYHDAGIRLLCDSAAVVDSSLVIIGREDRSDRHRKELKDLVSTVNCLLGQRPLATNGTQELSTLNSQLSTLNSPYTILLDHQPYNLEQAEAAGIDFQLSGHTHRGQVWPISWITDAIYECSWGSHQRGNTRYYVSSGIGIWGGKFRIGSQSEYVVATLKKGQNTFQEKID